MHQIVIGDITIDVFRKSIKNIHLSVHPPAGRVRIAAPLGVADETIRLYAISKLAWIKRNQRKFEQQERQPQRKLINRESHYFQGNRYLLRVTEQDAPPRVVIRTKKYLDLIVRPNTSMEQRQLILNEWYRLQLKEQISPLLQKWEEIVGVKADSWGVKLMKTKWGTCNIEARRIWINLELAKKPVACLEYIIVHELVHLIERHHNDKFISLLDKFMPQWRFYKDELNRMPVSHGDWDY